MDILLGQEELHQGEHGHHCRLRCLYLFHGGCLADARWTFVLQEHHLGTFGSVHGAVGALAEYALAGLKRLGLVEGLGPVGVRERVGRRQG